MVALSGPIAGEHPGWRRWAAVAVGFGGVLVIAHPSNETSWAVALPVLAGAFYAAGQLVARRVGGGIPAPVISWQQNAVYLVGALAASALLAPLAGAGGDAGSLGFLLRPWAMPAGEDFLLLALCGPIAGIGSTLIVYAYRSAGPGRIGPSRPRLRHLGPWCGRSRPGMRGGRSGLGRAGPGRQGTFPAR